MLVLPSPSPPDTSIDAQLHLDRRSPSKFSSSVVPVVLLSILAACIIIPFICRIAYLYHTGRDWTGCLQPSHSGPSSPRNANRDVITREMTIQTRNFAPGAYASPPPSSPAAPPYSPYPLTPIDRQPTDVHALVVPNAGNVSVPELPKVDGPTHDAPANGRTSRLGRMGSLRGLSWGRVERAEGPVQVHVRVSTVYDRPVSDVYDETEESMEGSSEGGGRSEESGRSTRGARSPPPAYPISADGHV